jgi:preprotein translocase subunit SecE
VAERKRRADDDTVDSVDAVDEDLDEATADAPADEDEKPARRSRAKTEVKKTEAKAKDGKKKSSKDKDKKPANKDVKEGRRGPIARIGRFIREVIAELRKVIWPNRKDLVTYATVVIIFVAVMLTIVGFLDLGFARATLAVFGSGSGK